MRYLKLNARIFVIIFTILYVVSISFFDDEKKNIDINTAKNVEISSLKNYEENEYKNFNKEKSLKNIQVYQEVTIIGYNFIKTEKIDYLDYSDLDYGNVEKNIKFKVYGTLYDFEYVYLGNFKDNKPNVLLSLGDVTNKEIVLPAKLLEDNPSEFIRWKDSDGKTYTKLVSDYKKDYSSTQFVLDVEEYKPDIVVVGTWVSEPPYYLSTNRLVYTFNEDSTYELNHVKEENEQLINIKVKGKYAYADGVLVLTPKMEEKEIEGKNVTINSIDYEYMYINVEVVKLENGVKEVITNVDGVISNFWNYNYM